MSNISRMAAITTLVCGAIAGCYVGADPTSSGASTGGGSGLGSGPFAGPSVCTSKVVTVPNPNATSPDMRPGEACLSCHDQDPIFSLAGTVYPTGHEPSNCDGSNGLTNAITVVITGADKKVTTLDVSRAGNFFTPDAIAMPYRAKVVSGGKERAMAAAQTSGDCNSCHGDTGTKGAPGRIVAP